MTGGIGGVSVMLAVENSVAFTVLVAVTVTSWLPLTLAGAVYRPPVEILPTVDGLIDQVTDWFAVNCCVWPWPKVTLDGPTDTGTIARVTIAVPKVVPSAALVAVMVTV